VTVELKSMHRGVTGRFPAPQKSELSGWELDADQCRHFEKHGYVAGIDLLDADQVAELRERLTSVGERLPQLADRLYEVEQAWLEHPQTTVLHFLGGWMVDELLHDLVFHPGVTVPLAQLLHTPRLRFWHDQVFWKPARHPGVVPWHQDYSYWTRTGPPAHISLFIALDDMGPDSGCPDNGGLEFVPGSHRWGLFPAPDFGGDMDALLEHLSAQQREQFQPRAITLLAGQASIHHSHLIHGSGGNPSDRPRRALVLNYVADGTLVQDDSAPLLAGVKRIPKGDPLDGVHFPLVLDRS